LPPCSDKVVLNYFEIYPGKPVSAEGVVQAEHPPVGLQSWPASLGQHGNSGVLQAQVLALPLSEHWSGTTHTTCQGATIESLTYQT